MARIFVAHQEAGQQSPLAGVADAFREKQAIEFQQQQFAAQQEQIQHQRKVQEQELAMQRDALRLKEFDIRERSRVAEGKLAAAQSVTQTQQDEFASSREYLTAAAWRSVKSIESRLEDTPKGARPSQGVLRRMTDEVTSAIGRMEAAQSPEQLKMAQTEFADILKRNETELEESIKATSAANINNEIGRLEATLEGDLGAELGIMPNHVLKATEGLEGQERLDALLLLKADAEALRNATVKWDELRGDEVAWGRWEQELKNKVLADSNNPIARAVSGMHNMNRTHAERAADYQTVISYIRTNADDHGYRTTRMLEQTAQEAQEFGRERAMKHGYSMAAAMGVSGLQNMPAPYDLMATDAYDWLANSPTVGGQTFMDNTPEIATIAAEAVDRLRENPADPEVGFYAYLQEKGVTPEDWGRFVSTMQWATSQPEYARYMQAISGEPQPQPQPKPEAAPEAKPKPKKRSSMEDSIRRHKEFLRTQKSF